MATERIQSQIDRLSDQVEKVADQEDWEAVRTLAQQVFENGGGIMDHEGGSTA